VVLAYLLSRRRFVGGEAPSLSAGGASDCCRNRQNWIIRFAKPDSPVFPVSGRNFRFLSVLCGNNLISKLSHRHRILEPQSYCFKSQLFFFPLPCSFVIKIDFTFFFACVTWPLMSCGSQRTNLNMQLLYSTENVG
jgi:hypothetical protein